MNAAKASGSDTLYALAALTVGTIAGSNKLTSSQRPSHDSLTAMLMSTPPGKGPTLTKQQQRLAADRILLENRRCWLAVERFGCPFLRTQSH
ncbi:hypothetical protein ACFPVT_09650 [Corynebacterium choanae]|uniref:Uncharacterized protein n=1 Tax=Corynebacterium choanae TaxID=1862358 RepID=A0A3G6JC42_9CORY|nr:hypothetical protein [Corynebacterium choanae]AZA14240.1 hypothetical protein CCHOA_09285 [Corynebacterium choanae]